MATSYSVAKSTYAQKCYWFPKFNAHHLICGLQNCRGRSFQVAHAVLRSPFTKERDQDAVTVSGCRCCVPWDYEKPWQGGIIQKNLALRIDRPFVHSEAGSHEDGAEPPQKTLDTSGSACLAVHFPPLPATLSIIDLRFLSKKQTTCYLPICSRVLEFILNQVCTRNTLLDGNSRC